jgi:diacylglycerol kinase family enzyme
MCSCLIHHAVRRIQRNGKERTARCRPPVARQRPSTFSRRLPSAPPQSAISSFSTAGTLRLRRFTAELAHEGRIERVRTVQVAVGNGRHYGGGMTVAAMAALDDGLLHGYSLKVRHGRQLLALVPALRRGRYEAWRAMRSFACRELEVRTRRPRPVSADGEIVTTTPARFRVHPGAVRVYAPGVARG